MSDLKILQELAKTIGQTLRRIDFNSVWQRSSYSIDEKYNITGLNLNKLNLKQLPSVIFKLSNLQRLDVSSNQLSALPPEISFLSNLQKLDISSNQLSALPLEISSLSNLQRLDASSNQLSALPPEISFLSNLEILDASSNQLSILPPEISFLSNLEILDIRSNQLSALPPEISSLSNLESLDIRSNQLSALPPEISSLSNLEILNVSSNQLGILPPEIFSLSNLERLDVSSNQLSVLPSEISLLSNLLEMYVGSNQLSVLPPETSSLNNLQRLDVYENPLEKPPIEVAEQGIEAIRNYFKSVEIAKKTVALYEAKLLVVGEGGVGKTTLTNALFEEGFVFDAKQDQTTEGIDIRQWQFSCQDKNRTEREFTANIWDFGGQEIYHATHQFFLTHRSLYLFVWDARQEYHELGFDYWVNVINLLSNKSPVIMVMNKKEVREKVIDESTLQDKFPNIVSFHKVSCATGEGITELRNKIQECLQKLPHIGEVLPKEWLDLRKDLENEQRDWMPYTDYLAFGQRYNMDKKRVNFLSRYFHDLAGILHFQDHLLLRDFFILNPEWATHAVYDVLDTKSIQVNKGKFRFRELEDIWDETKYPVEKHPHLLELMKKFELAFQFEDSPEYLVPELLPGDRPKFSWEESNNLRFEYRYDFMPKGIITRFIVRNHTLIKKEYYWKHGVVLHKEDTRARVISDYYNRKITIAIQGSFKKELLAILRSHLEHIHKTLNHPPLQEMIPCNCSKCGSNPQPHYFDYAYLRKRHQHSKTLVDCPRSVEDVWIEDLLSGIQIARPQPREEWQVFISYSSKDFAAVQEIVIDLKNRGISYWWDEEQIQPGDMITDQIETGLTNSRAVLLCVSYNQLQSGWSRVEYTAILNKVITDQTNQKVIPLILDEMEASDLPPLLSNYKHVRRLDKKNYGKLLGVLSVT